MKKFTFKCTCGHTVVVDAMDHDDAKEKIVSMMTPEFVQEHWTDKHAGEPMPAMEDMMKMLDENIFEGDLSSEEDKGSN